MIAPSKVLPSAAAPPLVTSPIMDLKGKARAVCPVHRSPCLVTGASEVREKLMANAMLAAHVVNTRQHFPEVSPPKSRWLRKQYKEENSSSRSAFLELKKFCKSFSLRPLNPKSWEKASVVTEVTLVMITPRKEIS